MWNGSLAFHEGQDLDKKGMKGWTFPSMAKGIKQLTQNSGQLKKPCGCRPRWNNESPLLVSPLIQSARALKLVSIHLDF